MSYKDTSQLDYLPKQTSREGRRCDEHPDRPAVLICLNLGLAYCDECRVASDLRISCGYCPETGHCEIQPYYNELENSQ